MELNIKVSLKYALNLGDKLEFELSNHGSISIQAPLVYGLHNTKLDKWYIGSTITSLWWRMYKTYDNGHFHLILDGDRHPFIKIHDLNDWELVILYNSPGSTTEYIRAKENYYIKLYNSYDNGYNSTPTAYAGFYGKHHTEDSKLSASNAMKRYWENLSKNEYDNYCSKLSKATARSWQDPVSRANHLNAMHTKSYHDKMSAAKSGWCPTDEDRSNRSKRVRNSIHIVNKSGDHRFIHADELLAYINKGYYHGMKWSSAYPFTNEELISYGLIPDNPND